MANLFLCPRKIISGYESLDKAAPCLSEFGKKALVVTDNIMVSIGNVQKLTKVLDDNAIEYEVYADINNEPTDEMVYRGVRVYRKEKCDFLIAIGGGSPIDAMKAIGAMVANPGALNDYVGRELKKPTPPLVAIPTTAGTGSEATQFTIISDTLSNVKMLLKGVVLLPSLAIVDPQFTLSAPPNVTAATGIDALTHAIEAYTSRKAQPLSDTFALSACRRIFSNLQKAYANGADTEARKEMAIASLEAGIAFSNSSVTIIHGMSRPIGALFHVPHGISNAMLIEECLKFAAHGTLERFADIAKAAGVFEDGMSDRKAVEELIVKIACLCKELSIPSLSEFGVDKRLYFESIEKMALDALASGSPANTRHDVNKENIVEIYKRLWK